MLFFVVNLHGAKGTRGETTARNVTVECRLAAVRIQVFAQIDQILTATNTKRRKLKCNVCQHANVDLHCCIFRGSDTCIHSIHSCMASHYCGGTWYGCAVKRVMDKSCHRAGICSGSLYQEEKDNTLIRLNLLIILQRCLLSKGFPHSLGHQSVSLGQLVRNRHYKSLFLLMLVSSQEILTISLFLKLDTVAFTTQTSITVIILQCELQTGCIGLQSWSLNAY